jgi:Domain of unknown function (DUF5011)/Chaperone of endosialidase
MSVDQNNKNNFSIINMNKINKIAVGALSTALLAFTLTYAAFPATPISPSDNITDPVAQLGAGCTPGGANCFIVPAGGGNIASGTTANATLFWNGSSWAENTTLLSNPNGNATLTRATSTNFFSSILNAITATFGSLLFGNATGTNLALTNALNITSGGTGTSTAPALGQILIGNASGSYNYISSTTLANSLIASTTLGAAVVGATSTGIFFLGPDGKLSQDVNNFNYDPISKKLTITGGVDPLFLQLKDVTTASGSGAYLEFYAGNLAATATTQTGRIIYSTTTAKFQVSVDNGPYKDIFIQGDNLLFARATGTAATTTNFFSNILTSLTGFFTNLFFINATGTNATTTGSLVANNFTATGTTNLATATIATLTVGAINVGSIAAPGIIGQDIVATRTLTAATTTLATTSIAQGYATLTNATITNVANLNSVISAGTSSFATTSVASSTVGWLNVLSNLWASVINVLSLNVFNSTTTNATTTDYFASTGTTTLATTSINNASVANRFAVLGTTTLASTTSNGALYANGDIFVNTGLRDSAGATGTIGQYLSTTGTSTKWLSITASGIASGTATGSAFYWNGLAWTETTNVLYSATNTTFGTSATNSPIFQVLSAANFATTAIATATIGIATITQATSTNFFASILSGLNAYLTNLWATNATVTNATTTANLAVTGGLTAAGNRQVISASGTVAVAQFDFLSGNGSDYSVDYNQDGIVDATDPIITLVRGQTYKFNVTTPGHPLEIRRSANGATYSAGVTNNTSTSGILTFTVPFNAPSSLAYQCTIHTGMAGVIKVVNASELVDDNGQSRVVANVSGVDIYGNLTATSGITSLATATIGTSTVATSSTNFLNVLSNLWASVINVLSLNVFNSTTTNATTTGYFASTGTSTLATTSINSASVATTFAVLGTTTLATTTSNGTLFVNGEVYINAALRDSFGATGTLGQYLQSTATSTKWTTISGALANGSATGTSLYWNGLAWVETANIYYSATNTRFGTSATNSPIFQVLSAAQFATISVATTSVNGPLTFTGFATSSSATTYGSTGFGPSTLTSGVAADSLGNTYVAVEGNGEGIKINPAGIATTLFTAGTPRSVVVDSLDNAYFTNNTDNNIYKVTSGGIVSTFVATITAPTAMTIDRSNNLYIISGTIVVKVTPAGVQSNIGTTGTGPQAIATDLQGNVYVTNSGSNNVTKINYNGGQSILGTTGTAPRGIVVDRDGNVFVANAGSSNVTRITAGGSSSVFGTAGTSPFGITIDDFGNLYVSNSGSGNISRITPGGVSSVYAAAGTGPRAITKDSNGNVYVLNTTTENVTKIVIPKEQFLKINASGTAESVSGFNLETSFIGRLYSNLVSAINAIFVNVTAQNATIANVNINSGIATLTAATTTSLFATALNAVTSIFTGTTTFSGAIQGSSISTDGTFLNASDTRLASQKAIKSYVDERVNGLAWRPAADVLSTSTDPLAQIVGQTSYTVDGYTVANTDRILFTAVTIGTTTYQSKVFKVSGVGTSIALTLETDGLTGNGTATTSDTISVQNGILSGNKNYTYSSSGVWVLGSALNGALTAANNLSELTNATSARNNLRLGATSSVTFNDITTTGTNTFATNTVASSSIGFLNVLSSLWASFINVFNLSATNATITNATTTNIYNTGRFAVLGTSTLATTTINGSVIANGDLFVNFGLRDSAGATGTAGQYLSTTGTSTKWLSISGSIANGSATGTALYWNGTAWVETANVYYSATTTTFGTSATNSPIFQVLSAAQLATTTIATATIGTATINGGTASLTRATITQATTTNFFTSILSALTALIDRLTVTGTSSLATTSINNLSVDRGIFIASNTPATTTNTLYNIGNQLYFNGQIVGAGGSASATGTAGTVQITNGAGQLMAAQGLVYSTSTGILSYVGTSTFATTTINNLSVENYLKLASTTTPTATNTLYAQSTDLYWNGARLITSTNGGTLDYFYAQMGTSNAYAAAGTNVGTFIGPIATQWGIQGTAAYSNRFAAATVVSNMTSNAALGYITLQPGRQYQLRAGFSANGAMTWTQFGDSNNNLLGRPVTISNADNANGFETFETIVSPTSTMNVQILSSGNGTPINSSFISITQIPTAGTAAAAGGATGTQGQIQFNFGGVMTAANWFRVSTSSTNQSVIIGSDSLDASSGGGGIITDRGITLASNTAPTTTANTLYALGTDLYWSGARFQIATTAPSGTVLDYQFLGKTLSQVLTTTIGEPVSWQNGASQGNMAVNYGTGAVTVAPGRAYELTAQLVHGSASALAWAWYESFDSGATWVIIPRQATGEAGNVPSTAIQLSTQSSVIGYSPTTTRLVSVRIMNATNVTIQTTLGVNTTYAGSFAAIKQLPIVGTAVAAGNTSLGQLQFNIGGVMAAADWLRASTSSSNRALVVSDNQNLTASDFGGSIYAQNGITIATNSTPTTTANTLYALGTDLFWSGARFQIATTAPSGTRLDYFYIRTGRTAGGNDGSIIASGVSRPVTSCSGSSGQPICTSGGLPVGANAFDLRINEASSYPAFIDTNMAYSANTGRLVIAPGRTYKITASINYSAVSAFYNGIITNSGRLIAENYSVNQAYNVPQILLSTVYTPTTTESISLVGTANSNYAVGGNSYWMVEQLPVVGTALAAGNASSTGVQGQLQFNFGGVMAAANFLRVATDTGYRSLIVSDNASLTASDFGGSIYSERGITFASSTSGTTTARTLYAQGDDLFWSGARFQIATSAPSGTRLDFFFGRVGLDSQINGSNNNYTAQRGVGSASTAVSGSALYNIYFQKVTANMSNTATVDGEVTLAPGRAYKLSALFSNASGPNVGIFDAVNGNVYAYAKPSSTIDSTMEGIITPTTTTRIRLATVGGQYSPNFNSYLSITQLPIVGTALAAGNASSTSGVQGQLQFNFGGVLAALDGIRVSTTTNRTTLIIGAPTTTTEASFGGDLFVQSGITLASNTAPTTTANTLYAVGQELFWSGARFQIATSAPSGTRLDYFYSNNPVGTAVTSNVTGPILWINSDTNMANTASTDGAVMLAPGRSYEIEAHMNPLSTASYENYEIWNADTNVQLGVNAVTGIVRSLQSSYTSQSESPVLKGIITPTTTTRIKVQRSNAAGSTNIASFPNYWGGGTSRTSYFVVKQLPVVGTALAAGNASSSGVQGQLQFNFGGVMAAANFLRVATDTGYRSLIVSDNASLTASDFGGSIYSERGITFASSTSGTTTARTLYAQGDDLFWSGARFQIATSAPSGTRLDFFYSRPKGYTTTGAGASANVSGATTLSAGTSATFDQALGGNLVNAYTILWDKRTTGGFTSYQSNMSNSVDTDGKVILAPGRIYELTAFISNTSGNLDNWGIVDSSGASDRFLTQPMYHVGAGVDGTYNRTQQIIIAPTTTMSVKVKVQTTNTLLSSSYFSVKQLPIVGTALAAGNSTSTGLQGQLQFNFGGVLAALDGIRVSTTTNRNTLLINAGASTTEADFGGDLYVNQGITFGSTTAPTTTARTLYAVGSELFWSGARFQIATTAPSGTRLDFLMARGITGTASLGTNAGVISWSTIVETNMAHTVQSNGRVILAPGRTYELEGTVSFSGATSLDDFEWRNAVTGQTIPGTRANIEGSGHPTYDQSNTARAIFTPTTTTEVALFRLSTNSSLAQDWQGTGSYIIVKQLPVVGTALAAGNASSTGVQGQLQFNFGGVMAAANFLRVATDTGYRSLIVSDNASLTASDFGGSIYSERGITFASSTSGTTTARTLYAQGDDLYWSGARFQIATSAPSGTRLDWLYSANPGPIRTTGQTWTWDNFRGNMSNSLSTNGQIILAPGRVYELEAQLLPTGESSASDIFSYCWYDNTRGGNFKDLSGNVSDTGASGEGCGNIYKAGVNNSYGLAPLAKVIVAPTTTTIVSLRQQYNNGSGWNFTSSSFSYGGGSFISVKQLPVVGTALAAGNASSSGVQGQLQFNFGGVLAALDGIRVSTTTNRQTLLINAGASTTEADFGGDLYVNQGITFGSTTAPTTTARTLYAVGEDLFWSGARFQIATSAPSGTKLDYLYIRTQSTAGTNESTIGASGMTVLSNAKGSDLQGGGLFNIGDVIYPVIFATGHYKTGNMAYDPNTGTITLAPGRTYRLQADLRNANSYHGFATVGGKVLSESYSSLSQQAPSSFEAYYTPTTTEAIRLYSGASGAISIGGGSNYSVTQLPVVGTALAAGNASSTSGIQGQLQFNFGGVMAAADFLRVATDSGYRSLIVSDNASLTAADFGGSIYSERGITFSSSTVGTTTANTLYAQAGDLYWSGARFQIATSAPAGTKLDYFYGRANGTITNSPGTLWTSRETNMSYNPTNGFISLAPGRTYMMTLTQGIENVNSNGVKYIYRSDGLELASSRTIGTAANTSYNGSGLQFIYSPTTTTAIYPQLTTAVGNFDGGQSSFIITQVPAVGTALAAGNATSTGTQGQIQFNFGGVMAASDFFRYATSSGKEALVIGAPAGFDISTIGGSVYSAGGISIGTVTPATTSQTLYSAGGLLFWNGVQIQAGATTSISQLGSAGAANTLDNLNYTQRWNWNSLTTGNAMILGADFLTSGSLFNVTSSSTGASGNGLVQIGLVGAGNTGTAFGVTNAGANSGYVARFNDDGSYTDSTAVSIDNTGKLLIGALTSSMNRQGVSIRETGTPDYGDASYDMLRVNSADAAAIRITDSGEAISGTLAVNGNELRIVGPNKVRIARGGGVNDPGFNGGTSGISIEAPVSQSGIFLNQMGGCQAGSVALKTDSSGEIFCGSVISDERLKNVGDSYTGALDALENVDVKYFTYKEGNGLASDGEKPHLGFIAQNLQQYVPLGVATRTGVRYASDTQEFLTLDTLPILASAVQAIKELNKKVFSSATVTALSIDELTASTTISLDTKMRALGLNASKVNQMLAQLEDLNSATSSTATSTDINGNLSTSESRTFIGKLFDRITKWLGEATNGIAKIFVGEVETKKLCVADDNGIKTCLTKTQLDALLASARVVPATNVTVPTCVLPLVLSTTTNLCALPPSTNSTTTPPTSTTTPIVADTVAPVVTVTAGTDTVVVGAAWVDAGATVTDNVSPAPSAVPTGSVDTATVGTYTVTYTATDDAGNIGTATRTVTVQ